MVMNKEYLEELFDKRLMTDEKMLPHEIAESFDTLIKASLENEDEFLNKYMAISGLCEVFKNKMIESVK
jgi:hypothetical protein